jgi:hypothetical protein
MDAWLPPLAVDPSILMREMHTPPAVSSMSLMELLSMIKVLSVEQ